jgi:phage gp46-like protein
VSDRLLDPVTADFVDAPGGGFEPCDDIDNMIAFSYSIPIGSWEGDPQLGHRFDELANATNTVDNRNRLRDLATLAVQWIIDLGLLDSVDVIVEEIGDRGDAVAFEVDRYKPGAQRAKRLGPFLVPVGG